MSYNGTISVLLSNVTQISKSNKYRVIIGIDGREVSILAFASSMPGRISTPVDVFYRGRKAQIRGESSYDASWTVEFYNNVDLNHRKLFLDWMERVHSYKVDSASPLENAIGGNALTVAKNAYGSIRSAVNDIESVSEDGGKSFIGSLLGQGSAPYTTTIKIIQLDNNSEELFSETLIGAFPIEVSDIQYSDSNAEITSTTVTFAFSDIDILHKEDTGKLGLN